MGVSNVGILKDSFDRISKHFVFNCRFWLLLLSNNSYIVVSLTRRFETFLKKLIWKQNFPELLQWIYNPKPTFRQFCASGKRSKQLLCMIQFLYLQGNPLRVFERRFVFPLHLFVCLFSILQIGWIGWIWSWKLLESWSGSIWRKASIACWSKLLFRTNVESSISKR